VVDDPNQTSPSIPRCRAAHDQCRSVYSLCLHRCFPGCEV